MKSLYDPPADSAQDIVEYDKEVRRFLAGEMNPDLFKAHRVTKGIYEQRQDGTFMVRIRIAAGRFTSEQGDAIAQLANEFGNGQLHVTSRQDLQLHDVKIADTPEIMRRLLDVGICCRGGGGNTVRNVSASPFAGVCPAESFDVTPFAAAVTEYLITLPGSFNLPRKYKLAFAGSINDAGYAQITDLGFIAEQRDGKPGFQVYAGGGMGANSRIGALLFDWIPASDCVRLAEAVRRFFDRHGDRTNKNRARLRFVFERLELEQCRNEIRELLEQVSSESTPLAEVDVDLLSPAPEAVPMAQQTPRRISGVKCLQQRQEGLYSVIIPLPMGFTKADHFSSVIKLADTYSDAGQLRTTQNQDLLLTNLPESSLQSFSDALRGVSEELTSQDSLHRFVACAGASTCRLGICLARNAAAACAKALDQSSITPETLDVLDLRISGCPNACGQHLLADIGFFGGARRHEGRLYPSYQVVIGARPTGDSVQFAKAVGAVPARRMPDALAAMASSFEESRLEGERFDAFSTRVGLDHFEDLLTPFRAPPAYDDDPLFYRDHGQCGDFSLAGRGPGECGAGVFDLVRTEIDTARDAYPNNLPVAFAYAVRALLVTRGVDTKSMSEACRAFKKEFVQTGLAADEFIPLLDNPEQELNPDQVGRLLDRVELLFSTLDASLKFHPPEEAEPSSAEEPEQPAADASIDLRGVACPMNFVKAKLRLEMIPVGSVLSIVLDSGEPIKNVPASFRSEGHRVLAETDLGDGTWKLDVRKEK